MKLVLLLFSTLLLVSFQNCSRIGFGFNDSGSSNRQMSGGGDGTGYEGKPGDYYRVIPDFRCGPNLALFGKITVGRNTIDSEIINPDCSISRATVPTANVTFSQRIDGLLAFGEGLYLRSQNAPDPAQQNVERTEAWCRNPTSGLEVAIAINYANGSMRSTVVNGQTSTTGTIGVRTQSTQLTYLGSGLELRIDTSSPLNSSGELPATFRYGTSPTDTLNCRLAARLDPKGPTSSTPLPPPALSQNRLAYSESFDNPAWYRVAANMTANSNLSAAPDGTFTADLFYEDTSDAYHILGQRSPVPYATGATLTYSVFVKPQGDSQFYNKVQTPDGANYVTCAYDVLTMSVTQLRFGTASVPNCSIEPFPNGWFRLIITGIPSTVQTQLDAETYIYKGGQLSFPGDGFSGALLWGAQLQSGTQATSYRATTNSTAP